MIAMLKYAAVASVASMAAGLAFFAAMPQAEARSAFAEAAARLQNARTISYRISVRMPGQDAPITGREYSQDPGLIRTEMDPPQAAITITDLARGKILSLDPAGKLAFLQDWKLPGDLERRSKDRTAESIKYLRSLATKEGQPAGRRKIGEVDAQGFRVEEPEGLSWTVWVDPERKFPLLIETTFRVDGRETSAAMSEFRLDADLDPALFRLDPPEGYALRKVDAPIVIGEPALVNLLRIYAEAADGAFPPKPVDGPSIQKVFPKEKWTGPDDPKMIRLVQSLSASVVFLSFELKDAYGYRPEGVKLGEAGKVLFWYRKKGATTYRALFGDLHAEDVAAARLPEQPKF